MTYSLVLNTNIFISALLNPFGKSATVIELCFQDRFQAIMGTALLHEYEDVISRNTLFDKCLLTKEERNRALNDFLSVCRWVRVYYSWRPNLRDEGDNHLMELAIAGNANAIITHNIKDFRGADFSFPEVSILTAKQLLETI